MLKAFKFMFASSFIIFLSSFLMVFIALPALMFNFHIKSNAEIVFTSSLASLFFIVFIVALELILFSLLFKAYKTYFSFILPLYKSLNKSFLYLSVLAISTSISIQVIMNDYEKFEYRYEISNKSFSHIS